MFLQTLVETMKIFVLLSSLISVGAILRSENLNGRPSDFPFRFHQARKGNVGKPLILTPFLEKGNIQKAQQKSSVKLPHFKGINSFSGYFTVNKMCDSNLFFWFFPAQENWLNAPVVLWLQGGPGESSLIGQFEELGPISLNGEQKKRKYSWNMKNNLLFIDQPVGTGFSFTRKGCYAEHEPEVSRDLYSALIQFYQLFPSLQKNKLFITGESYGGHYVPSIAYVIHKNNPSAKTVINLSGLMIGNGFMDAILQNDYSTYLYQLGLVDDEQRDILQAMENKVIEQLKQGFWKEGHISLVEQLETAIKFIGNVSLYNFLENGGTPSFLWETFVTNPRIRKALHVGNNSFERFNMYIFSLLDPDSVISVKTKIEELLEHYPVIFYHGQLDIICAYPMAVNFFRSLHWSGARDYLQAERMQWCVQDQLAGYVKSAHNLHEVLVRAAGHSVPKDQPLWAFELMTSVTSSPADNPLQLLTACGGNS